MQNWLVPPDTRYQRALEEHHYVTAIDVAQSESERLAQRELKQAERLEAENDVAAEQGSSEIASSAELPESVQWRRRVADAKAAASSYQNAQIGLVESLIEREDWQVANQNVEFLQENLPENVELGDFLASVEKRRDAYIGGLQRTLLLQHSRAVPELIATVEKLHAADDGDRKLKKELHMLRNRRVQLVEELQARVAQAEAAGELSEALAYARALQRFQDSPDVLAKITSLRDALGTQATPTRTRQPRALSQRQKEQLNDYGVAIVEQRWVDARAILDAMLKERPADGELLGQDTYLKEVFQNAVSEARTRGEQLYAEGKIEDALATWRSVLPMAPQDLQLAANIERAQRILNKVEALKRSDNTQDAFTLEQ